MSLCNACSLCACTSSHSPVNVHTDIYAHHMHVHIKEKELAQNKTYYLKYTTNVSAKIKYLHLPKSMNQNMVILFLGHFNLRRSKISIKSEITLFLLLNFFTSTQVTLLQMEIFLIFCKEKIADICSTAIRNIYNIHVN